MVNFTASIILAALAFTQTPEVSQPITYVQRAEAVMLLLKNSNREVPPDAASNGLYPDILDNEWFVPYVMEALDLGMLDTEPHSGMIYPYRSVTRTEFLKMMTIAFDLEEDLPYNYNDIPSYAWYAAYAGIADAYDLFVDTASPTLLHPNFRITHQEASAAMLTLLIAEPHLRLRKPHAAAETTAASPTKKKIVFSTPSAIKQAFLTLIRSRKYNAEYNKLDLIEKINAKRVEHGLPPLTSNYYLELSAQRHAKDMAERGYFSHYTPEGKSYVDRIRASGYLDADSNTCSCIQQIEPSSSGNNPSSLTAEQEPCSCEPIFALGENLAKGQFTMTQAVEDWMDSPGHRANILRPEFEEIGVGLYEDVWVNTFGRLKSN